MKYRLFVHTGLIVCLSAFQTLTGQVLPDSSQLAALEAFRMENKGSWIVRWDPITGLPHSVYGGRTRSFGKDPETAARNFLSDYHNLFRIPSGKSHFHMTRVSH